MKRIAEREIITSRKVSEMLVKNGTPINTASHYYQIHRDKQYSLHEVDKNWSDVIFEEEVARGCIIPAWDINSLLAQAILKGSVLMRGRKIFEVMIEEKETNEIFYGCAYTVIDALGICIANRLKAGSDGGDIHKTFIK